eukprot:scaffold190495_cov15-Tisochrysis_lutea.AAC.1
MDQKDADYVADYLGMPERLARKAYHSRRSGVHECVLDECLLDKYLLCSFKGKGQIGKEGKGGMEWN